ncbi:hypothetical protein NPX13_g7227 [Xylaria arbuscula]|uniref:Transcription factor domain-containing protein n=1 Tax=Xylaria arbuscula TaxID=114810 RepID=A0A9W8NAR3_9PEZI|nr:hypothetical protein NPX13_g7227 [Xylaria arbuscula]
MAICALVTGRVRDGSVTNPRWDLSSLLWLDSNVFYLETQRQLASVGDQADVHTIRAHAILAITAIQNGRTRNLHKHLGIYHMLVDMYALHAESNWPFWSIYTLDVFQSVVWGGTIRSREQQTNVSYPIEVEDDLLNDTDDSHFNLSMTQASPGINTLSPSSRDSSSGGNDCWLFGWNFVTDLYRVLEHALTRFRGKQHCSRREGFLTDIYQEQSTVTATSVHNSAMAMYANLPENFKQTAPITYDSRKDLFGFQAANITASLQLLRIVLFTAEGASIQDRCRIASEVIAAFISIPVEYLLAKSKRLCCPWHNFWIT